MLYPELFDDLFFHINYFTYLMVAFSTGEYVLSTPESKCSKVLNTSYLPKRPRKTAQTKIRLLLKKQPHQGRPGLYSDKNFVNSNPEH